MASVDVFIVAEVWMVQEALPLVTFDEWKLLSSLYPPSSTGTTYGGLLVYYRNHLNVEILSLTPISWQPIIWLKIGDTILGTAYLPPDNSSFLTHWEENPISILTQQLARMSIKFPRLPFTLLGDFNARAGLGGDHYTSSRGRLLLASLPDDWKIIADGFTHITGDLRSFSTLDYFILNPLALSRLPSTSIGPLNLGLSDHAWLRLETSVSLATKQRIITLPHPVPPPPLTWSVADNIEEEILQSLPARPKNRYPPEFLPLDTTEINRLRKLAEQLQSLHRHNPTPHNRTEARKVYSQLSKARKRFRYRRRDHLASYLATLSPAEWWRYAQRLWRKKESNAIDIDGPRLVTYFSSLLHKNSPPIPHFEGPQLATSPFEIDFCDEEVEAVISKLKSSASGEDRITTEQIKQLPVPSITSYFNRILALGDTPASWSRMVMVTLPKPGLEPSTPEHLRGICLQNKFRKIFTALFTNRLFDFIQDKIPPTQCGFQPGRRTTENLFTLRTLHEAAVENNRPLFAAQIDLTKAFDAVSRPLLFQQLYDLGICGRLVTLLRCAYNRTEVFLKANRRFSSAIRADTGLPQGDPLSPLLFILYIIPLHLQHPEDPKLLDLSISFLGLADDYTLLSHTARGLQHKLDQLLVACQALSLSLNAPKCAVLAMGNLAGVEALTPFRVGDTVIPRKSEVTINGYLIREPQLRGGWDTVSQAAKLIHKSIRAFQLLKIYRHELGLSNPKAMLSLYNSIVLAQLAYSREIWFDTSKDLTKLLVKIQKSHLRYIVGVHCRAMTAIIYYDCRQLMAPYQSLLSAIKFLKYLDSRPPDSAAHRALQLQYSLNYGWFARLQHNLAQTGIDIEPYEEIGNLADQTHDLLWERQSLDLTLKIHDSSRCNIWRSRLSLLDPAKPLRPAAYLSLPRPIARNVARLRTSCTNAAIERLRIGNRSTHRLHRLCRHCAVVEDETHILVHCPEFTDLRQTLTATDSLVTRCLEGSPPEYATFLFQVLRRIDSRYVH